MSDRLYRPADWPDAEPCHVEPVLADPDPGLTSRQPFAHPAGPGWRPYREPAATGRSWLEAATAIPEPAWWTATRNARAGAATGPGRTPYLRPALDAADAMADMVEDMVEDIAGGVRLEQATPTGNYRLVRARVYRTDADPEFGGPRWYWHCPTCDMGGGHNCLHDVIHPPGTWISAFCGAFHHIHTRHPLRPAVQGEHPHTTLRGRRRCDWSPPSEDDLRVATYTLCGRTGYPSGPLARELAREVLALAGRRTP